LRTLACRYNDTVSAALWFVPFNEAEIVEVVERRTTAVLIRKDALLAPAGTNTLGGTLAAPLLLESTIVTPPAGAARVNVTVPVEDCNPPVTLVGFSVSEATPRGGSGRGATVSEADFVTPL